MLFYLGCDVGGKLDDLAGLAGEIQHRVVGALDPDLFTLFADSAELSRQEFTAAQGFPEGAIVGRLGVVGIDQQPVVLALQLFQLIAHCLHEAGIGIEDDAIQ